MIVSAPLLALACLLADHTPILEPLGRFDLRAIPEASGIARSRRHAGIFWVHNDSGNPPALFAIRRDGTVVREFRVAAPNVDWEDIAADGQGRLYLADIGNNGGLLALRAIYQIEEPDPAKPVTEPLKVTAATFYRFPETGRFDAEALICPEKSGSAVIFSKRYDRREAELFEVPLRPPAPLLRPALPRRVGSLGGFVEPVTGASLSEDGRNLAVCSYSVTRVYRRRADPSWELLATVRYPNSTIEGITWDGRDLILVGERQGVGRIAEATWRDAAEAAGP